MPLLSICIPTHDGRRRLLAELLDGIFEQVSERLRDRVEICVTDNASNDGTEAMIAEYQRRRPERIVYRRHDRDVGAIRNIFAALEPATGEYCWSLMSDDALAPGGLEEVVAALDAHPGVTGMNVNWQVLDAEMRFEHHRNHPGAMPPCDRPLVRYSDPQALLGDLGWVFCQFPIVRRAAWEEVVDGRTEELIRTSPTFAQSVALGLIAQSRPDWIWLSKVIVKNRDNPASSWVGDRPMYQAQVELLRDHTRSARALAAGRRDIYKLLLHKWYLLGWAPRFLVIHKLAPDATWRDDVKLLAGAGRYLYPLRAFWLHALPVLLTPHALVKRSARLRERYAAIDAPP